MNLLVVDATRTRVQPGDLAVLLGGKGRGLPIATELAERSGTIAYELTTRIAEHVPHRTI